VMTRRIAIPLLVLALAASAAAQFGRQLLSPRLATAEDFDGRFHFCRLAYQGSGRRGRGGWATDWPWADINLSIRLSELTRTSVSFARPDQPNHLIVRPTDDELFQCPFVLMSAPESAWFDEPEAARLREYLLKGGFLWSDDSWGATAWLDWVSQWEKVLPPDQFPVVDIPLDHPMLHMQFQVDEIPQIPAINHFLSSGGGTSERGADSAVPHARIVADADGRVMALMTHNTDISDSWEREAEDPSYFYTFGPRGYAFGINVLLYAMTH
jgi:hypothetical protein